MKWIAAKSFGAPFLWLAGTTLLFASANDATRVAGLELDAINPAILPGNDFFGFANGAWVTRTIIPPDQPGISTVSIAANRVRDDVRAIVQEVSDTPQPKGSDTAKLAAFYRSAMDQSTIDARGLNAIRPQLDQIRQAPDLAALAALMGRTNRDIFGAPFSLGIGVDPGAPSSLALTISQGGLGLPDPVYYKDLRFAATREAYHGYIREILDAEHWPGADTEAGAIVALETGIAAASVSPAAARDPIGRYNPTTVNALHKAVPEFPWRAFLSGAGLGHRERLVVAQRTAVPGIARIVSATPLHTLRAWLAFSVADNAAPYLGSPVAEISFRFRKKTLLGQVEPAPRWKQALQIVAGGDIFSPERADHFGNMGWAVGRLYVARHFPYARRTVVEAIAGNVRRAMAERLAQNDWLSAASKRTALAKLSAYRFKIGFPMHWRTYADVTIRPDDLIGNVLRLADSDWRHAVATLDRPVDRDAWQMTPQTVDAYHGEMLDLVFPAAVLMASYQPDADPAVNYGAVATIIGHELTHGFDDWGRHFDAAGRLHDWWTEGDVAAFTARSKRLAVQFSAFEALPGKHVNGDLTLGENIADLGGLSLAIDAYRMSLHGRRPASIAGFGGYQRVFLGWARYLRGKSTESALARQIVADPHAPRQFRVNGPVRNIDSWYRAFEVQSGQVLYLAPADRVRIW